MKDMALRYLALSKSIEDLSNQREALREKYNKQVQEKAHLMDEIINACGVESGQTKAIVINSKALLVNGDNHISIVNAETLDE